MSDEERHKKVDNETKRRHQSTHERREGINEGREGPCESEKTAARSQRSVICCGFAVEEEDVGLDTLSVEDAGWQAKQRVNISLLEKFAADGLPSPRLC